MLATPGSAQSASATPADGKAYVVTQILPRYVNDHPQHPPLGAILAAEVELGKVTDGYVGPRKGVPIRKFRLHERASYAPTRYYASALATINRAILGALNERGLAGVRVRASPLDIDPATGDDRRSPGQGTLRVDIEIGRIDGLRVVAVDTLAAGERVPAGGASAVPSIVVSRIDRRSSRPMRSAKERRTCCGSTCSRTTSPG